MGAIYSREKRDSSADFEQVLSKLDTDIRKVETRLSEIKIKQRKASFLWVIYSIVIWILCVLYLFYLFLNEITQRDIIYGGIPAILLPIGKLIVWWYDQRTKKEELKLATLRKEQKDKLEDLKKKTSYYTTQSLIEKYDESIAKKKKELEALELQQNKQKPVSLPANMGKQQPFPHKHHLRHPHLPHHAPNANTINRNIPSQSVNTPLTLPPSPPYPQQQQQQQQLHSQQQQQEVHWYDKIVDALVGDIGPESKYALICSHCYSHNGLVFKEEHDTIQYICPVCKQFNPSRKSKQQQMSSQMAAAAAAAAAVDTESPSKKDAKDVSAKEKDIDSSSVDEEKEEEEDDDEAVLAKMKAEYLKDDTSGSSIGSRVRQRRQVENQENSD
ncbi:hypothetical protein BDF20DRAFT_614749 [Mycotypha africana]|uniref:uncharacterized protein n=1 Tax=Mycotypha africana TaxID=64632 RepID=UPI0023007A8D|nr:uncharacterized protein BDF20DRAFT_614749 [Mycotypha africana]KAI8975556.1 hypothetical protein BDF20DRAFT_614749 [Mycotypha africana]